MKNKFGKLVSGILLFISSLLLIIVLNKANILYKDMFIVCFVLVTIIDVLLIIFTIKFNKILNYIVDIIISLIMLTLVIYINNTINFIKNMNNNIKQENKIEENIDIKKPFIIYISGIDTSGEIDNVSRSDVNIIAVVNLEKKKILLLNTPRDYYVKLHNTVGIKDKLTHAGMYGIDMSKSTLEDLYNIKIDYYIRLNFTSFIKVIDEIGDIEVYSDTTFKTSNKPYCNIKKGMNTLNSACALAYSRERYAYKTGDYHRGENQQEVIKGIVNKITKPESLLKYNKILSKLDGTLETNMNYETITELIKYELKNTESFEIESDSVAGSASMEYTYSIKNEKLYVTIPNEESVKRASEKVYEYLK